MFLFRSTFTGNYWNVQYVSLLGGIGSMVIFFCYRQENMSKSKRLTPFVYKRVVVVTRMTQIFLGFSAVTFYGVEVGDFRIGHNINYPLALSVPLCFFVSRGRVSSLLFNEIRKSWSKMKNASNPMKMNFCTESLLEPSKCCVSTERLSAWYCAPAITSIESLWRFGWLETFLLL